MCSHTRSHEVHRISPACVALLGSCRWRDNTCWAATTARFGRATNDTDDEVSGGSSSCHNEVVSECVRKLDLLSRNKSLAFATTEAELKRICDHLTDAMECVNGFTRRSRTWVVAMRITLLILISGAAYLKHSKCYKQLQDDYNYCAAVYMAQRAELQGQMLSTQEKIRLSCCQMDGYKNCAKTAVLRRCDVEAAELAEDIIVRLVATLCRRTAPGTESTSLLAVVVRQGSPLH
ncbi:hypothetical protein HPB49_020886 [Dermacentor silvarum]|uniref:Uncharacterized protein n=1 Tax=Dermacentor silvarum TaxID=543639 RepID=A0ACB8DRE6_DERSI|nr:hypothetical protein HPB49_020886 [Dermacentor silvarum]